MGTAACNFAVSLPPFAQFSVHLLQKPACTSLKQLIAEQGQPGMHPDPYSSWLDLSPSTAPLEASESSTVEIKIEPVNLDEIYRPGDTVRGHVILKGLDVEGRRVKQVRVKLVGTMMVSGFDGKGSQGRVHGQLCDTESIFYSSQAKLFPGLSSRYLRTIPLAVQKLPFSFALPVRDSTYALFNDGGYDGPLDQQKATAFFPPTARIESDRGLGKVRDRTGGAVVDKLKSLFLGLAKPFRFKVSYFLCAEVQWQRKLLHPNQLSATIELVVHPSPPIVAPACLGADGDTGMHRTGSLDLLERQSLLSPCPQISMPPHRMSFDLPQRQYSTLTSKFMHESPTAISSISGGMWVTTRNMLSISASKTVQVEFSYPLVPYMLMDLPFPFTIRVTGASALWEQNCVKTTEIKFRLFRHVSVATPCGNLCIEGGVEMQRMGRSIIRVSQLQKEDKRTSFKPQSLEEFSGQLLIESGRKQARCALKEARSVVLNATPQRHTSSPPPDTTLTTPSFSFRGLSVDYTIRVELGITRTPKADNEELDDKEPSSVVVVLESAPIALISQPLPLAGLTSSFWRERKKTTLSTLLGTHHDNDDDQSRKGVDISKQEPYLSVSFPERTPPFAAAETAVEEQKLVDPMRPARSPSSSTASTVSRLTLSRADKRDDSVRNSPPLLNFLDMPAEDVECASVLLAHNQSLLRSHSRQTLQLGSDDWQSSSEFSAAEVEHPDTSTSQSEGMCRTWRTAEEGRSASLF